MTTFCLCQRTNTFIYNIHTSVVLSGSSRGCYDLVLTWAPFTGSFFMSPWMAPPPTFIPRSLMWTLMLARFLCKSASIFTVLPARSWFSQLASLFTPCCSNVLASRVALGLAGLGLAGSGWRGSAWRGSAWWGSGSLHCYFTVVPKHDRRLKDLGLWSPEPCPSDSLEFVVSTC